MYSFLEALKKLYNTFFENFVRTQIENQCKSSAFQNLLSYIWLLFSYSKKTLLKRKNEKIHSIYLICTILEDIRNELCKNVNTYGNKNLCGNFDLYIKEITQYFSISDTNNFERNSLSFADINSSVKKYIIEFNFSLENLKKKYEEILIPDEIDDNKIFENFFIDIKLKNTPMRNKIDFNFSANCSDSNSSQKLSFSTPHNIFSCQSTANTQKINNVFSNFSNSNSKNCHSIDSSPIFKESSKSRAQSPYKIFLGNEKLNFEQFFEEIREYQYLDVSYLYKKFSKFNINNNLFTYLDFYEIFFSIFIENIFLSMSTLTNMEKEDFKNALLNLNNHKNLYIRLIDELFMQERSKFKVQNEGFNILLNDPSFHQNFLIISIFVFLNLRFLEKPQFLMKINLGYFSNLNKYQNFDFINIFRIVTNLTKINLPFNFKNIIKKFQNCLINYTIWQSDSFLFQVLLHGAPEITHDEDSLRTLRNIMRKVYIYTGSVIYKLSKSMKIDSYIRERIWIVMKNLIKKNYEVLKNNLLDTVILNMFNKVINYNLEEEIFSFNDILCKFIEIKPSINTELFDIVFQDTNKKLQYIDHTFLEYLLQPEIIFNNSQSQNDFMEITLDFSSILPYLQEDYNVILTLSPNPIKFKESLTMNVAISSNCINQEPQESAEPPADFLGNKRIRPLTPLLSTKTLTYSPYNMRSSFTSIKNNTAFKNLNTLFSSLKKENS